MIATKKHLNQYNVICPDIAAMRTLSGGADKIEEWIVSRVTEELKETYLKLEIKSDFPGTLMNAVMLTGRKFIMVIDEWDVLIRDAGVSDETGKNYLEFLCSLFKNLNVTDMIFAAVYMTGILPIKKDGSQTALSNFTESGMIRPGEFACSIGFAEDEVRELCEKNEMDFETMKRWYDGYRMGDAGSICNSNSVMETIKCRKYASYWWQTAAAEALIEDIGLDYGGLSKAVAELIAGKSRARQHG